MDWYEHTCDNCEEPVSDTEAHGEELPDGNIEHLCGNCDSSNTKGGD